VLRRSGRRLAQAGAEAADAQAACLCLDGRLELVILPNEPHQLLQLLILPHQPLDLMPEPLIIELSAQKSWGGMRPRSKPEVGARTSS
uniref:Uncharacterized protein n=1 Tax=Suricata suricatta TaxID=37032 RepID=A0A673VRS8_SURSU